MSLLLARVAWRIVCWLLALTGGFAFLVPVIVALAPEDPSDRSGGLFLLVLVPAIYAAVHKVIADGWRRRGREVKRRAVVLGSLRALAWFLLVPALFGPDDLDWGVAVLALAAGVSWTILERRFDVPGAVEAWVARRAGAPPPSGRAEGLGSLVRAAFRLPDRWLARRREGETGAAGPGEEGEAVMLPDQKVQPVRVPLFLRAGVVVVPLLALFLLVPSLRPWAVVRAGYQGVVLQFGAVKGLMPPGLHLKVPTYAVVPYDVRVQKAQADVDAASRDLQMVMATVAVNYYPEPDKVDEVHQNIGPDYADKVVTPRVHEAVKAVTAQYTAEELITRRQEVRDQIKTLLAERLRPYGIRLDDFSVVNFNFSQEFNAAIEAKQTAEQLALKAQRDLERVKIEAEQKLTQARAEAEALRIQKQNVTPELIRLREIEAQMKAIEKWNGVLPYATGGAVPFISLTPPGQGGQQPR